MVPQDLAVPAPGNHFELPSVIQRLDIRSDALLIAGGQQACETSLRFQGFEQVVRRRAFFYAIQWTVRGTFRTSTFAPFVGVLTNNECPD